MKKAVIIDKNKTHTLISIYENGRLVGDHGGRCIPNSLLESFLKKIQPAQVEFEIKW